MESFVADDFYSGLSTGCVAPIPSISEIFVQLIYLQRFENF